MKCNKDWILFRVRPGSTPHPILSWFWFWSEAEGEGSVGQVGEDVNLAAAAADRQHLEHQHTCHQAPPLTLSPPPSVVRLGSHPVLRALCVQLQRVEAW